MTAKKKLQGRGKPTVTVKAGSEQYRETGEWRDIERVVDRENDLYRERIVDADGNEIKNVEEPLSDHQGHSWAKRRKGRPGP